MLFWNYFLDRIDLIYTPYTHPVFYSLVIVHNIVIGISYKNYMEILLKFENLYVKLLKKAVQ